MKKFLTIGSMCDLVGDENNTKYLIIGYKKKRKDYEAVLFPGGTTGKDPVYKYFNADEVDEIYDLGYKDQVAIDYVNDLFSKKEPEIDFYDETSVVSNINSSDDTVESQTEEKKNILTGIKFDENGIVIEDPNGYVPESFAFDENGVVIEDYYANKIPSEDISNDKYVFDENGVVIEDNTSLQKKESLFKFDENGVVIEDMSSPKESISSYKFDENGVVIEDSNGYVPSNSKYNFKFDENGVVIAE